ncbi:MAG TPA: PhzF family phenazine biosynthesis protein [Streptosporangiaceae bacterium]|jgi:PhzF family phenazine biosynthesis protein
MQIFHVDAFTTGSAFSGNPAAVCLLGRPADPAWMQRVAAEMNLAETAFVEPRDGCYGLRWFTPVVEVALCGHATLASAHVLYETGRAAAGQEICFDSASGQLIARQDGDAITLDFPATPAAAAPAPAGLLAALGARSAAWTGAAQEDFMVVLDSEQDVLALQPDQPALAAATAGLRGTIVTAPAAASRDGADFVSRFFAPGVGIAEDPVTGSAHCTLAPYWCERLGRAELTGYQASARGGTVRVALAGDRVILTGQAVTVLGGELSRAARPAAPAVRAAS